MTELVQEEIKNLDIIQNNNNNDKEKIFHNNKSNHFSQFLLQLYNILEEEKYKNIIHWGDNGKYFIIENVHDFSEKLLPKYYNHNNYSSCVRQLNMYDFHKKRTNSDGHTFQHSRFIKGQKELIKTILRKRKKDKNKIINSLIPLNMELIKYNDNYNINNYKNKIDNKDNLSFDKLSLSLSLDEEKDNSQSNLNNANKNSLIEYNNKKYFPQTINDKLSAFHLKQNLLGQNGNNNINLNFNINNNINNINDNNNNIQNGNDNKKSTKKTINDLLNCLINNVKENIKSQQKLNTKIDLLSNKNLEYINKNNSILDEIKSKIDYNKKFETVVSFILEIQKIKNEGTLKNILISNDINNNHLQDDSNDLNNLEILNLPESKKEINNIVPTNEFLKKKTYNNGIVEPFQTFLNKYVDKNKTIGLLTNEEMIKNKNINNININKNETKNMDFVMEDKNKDKENENNIEDYKIISNNILKDNIFEERKKRNPSFDFNSTIFKRRRSSSFNSLFSNNTNNFNDNINNNDFIFKKDGDSNTKNDNSIIWNNNPNYNYGINLNKSFENDFNQNNINIERKDSLNNSLISFTDLGNKSSHMGDIFGGDNNSINFT